MGGKKKKTKQTKQFSQETPIQQRKALSIQAKTKE